MDVTAYNREAWNRLVGAQNQWTVPVSHHTVEAARRGDWQIVLTPTKPVPRGWFGPLQGTRVLCLASGGGQQAPILAAAGATVTVLDNSPAQLAQDRLVAEREGLQIDLQLGQMDNLSRFDNGAFDLIFHPVSNLFVPDVRPVWKEAHRVLRPGGALLAGFANPVGFLFDAEREERGELALRYAVPYSDLTSRSTDELAQLMESGEPVEFGHSLVDQIGGQIAAGFSITGFYEDEDPRRLLGKFIPLFIATRATRA